MSQIDQKLELMKLAVSAANAVMAKANFQFPLPTAVDTQGRAPVTDPNLLMACSLHAEVVKSFFAFYAGGLGDETKGDAFASPDVIKNQASASAGAQVTLPPNLGNALATGLGAVQSIANAATGAPAK